MVYKGPDSDLLPRQIATPQQLRITQAELNDVYVIATGSESPRAGNNSTYHDIQALKRMGIEVVVIPPTKSELAVN